MEQDSFRLKNGQAYVFTATRPCKVRFARHGAARFSVTVSDYMPGLEASVVGPMLAVDPADVAPEPASSKGKKRP